HLIYLHSFPTRRSSDLIRMTVSFPLPKPLFDHTSRVYPTFNMAIPDQYRVDVFERELRERWESGREPFPQLVTMVLPQDHLTEPDRKSTRLNSSHQIIS